MGHHLITKRSHLCTIRIRRIWLRACRRTGRSRSVRGSAAAGQARAAGGCCGRRGPVLWTALLVIAFRGITAIVFGQGSAPAAGGAAAGSTADSQFPVAMAEAYAAEFGRAYLSVSPQNQGQREQALAAFMPASVSAADPNLGWNGVGQLNLQLEQVVGVSVHDSRHAVVTLLAMVNGQLMELGVPVAVSGGGLVVTGEPAWLPAPPQAPLPTAAQGGSDPVAQSQLMNELPAFFQACAGGDSAALACFEPRGVSLTGLGGCATNNYIGVIRQIGWAKSASRKITLL